MIQCTVQDAVSWQSVDVFAFLSCYQTNSGDVCLDEEYTELSSTCTQCVFPLLATANTCEIECESNDQTCDCFEPISDCFTSSKGAKIILFFNLISILLIAI